MASKKISGIYKIINVKDNKFYLGSSKNIKKRWYEHKRLLKKKSHPNIKLQTAWNKSKEQSFEFVMIETTAEKKLHPREQYWLDILRPYENDNGYNIARVACGPHKIKRACKVKGCKNKHSGLGYCGKHYQRYRKYGKVEDDCLHHLPIKNRGCKVKGCSGRHDSHGYCGKHAQQIKRYGKIQKSKINRNHSETCKVKGCKAKYCAKGYCDRHYRVFKKHGMIPKQYIKLKPIIKNRKCKFKGCGRKHEAKGLCTKHYSRMRRRIFGK